MALQPTKASEYRKKKKPYLFQVNANLTILLKRVDMVAMIITGAVPLGLLDAADKFEKIRDEIKDDTTPEEAVKKLKMAGDEGEFRQFLEKFAAYVALEPKIHADLKTPVPDDAIPAEDLELLELIAIWTAHPEDEVAAPEVPNPVTFRSGQSEPDNSPAPDGESVRPATESVDRPAGEFIFH